MKYTYEVSIEVEGWDSRTRAARRMAREEKERRLERIAAQFHRYSPTPDLDSVIIYNAPEDLIAPISASAGGDVQQLAIVRKAMGWHTAVGRPAPGGFSPPGSPLAGTSVARYSFRVSVHFTTWFRYRGDAQEQIRREMARRKEVRRRIAEAFRAHAPKVDEYFVWLCHAPPELAEQIARFVGNVRHLEIVREAAEPRPVKTSHATGCSSASSKRAVMSRAEVCAFLRGRGVLECEADGTTSRLQVEHRPHAAASSKAIDGIERTLGLALTPSHRRLLEVTDGCVLFADASRRGDTGLVLYSTKQLVRRNAHKRRQRGASDVSSNLLVVGEPVGLHNHIAVDYQQSSKLQEAPIVYIDHEGGDADGRVVAESFEDLLRRLKRDPVALFCRQLDGSVLCPGIGGGPLVPKSYRRGS